MTGYFHDAVREGEFKKIWILLKIRPGLASTKDEYGLTPLHLAASYGHKNVAELLLASNAEVNAVDGYGLTPLHRAASNSHGDIVELLLANKADVSAEDNDGETPLHYVEARGAAELLLAAKAKVNAKDKHGLTPLHCRAAGGGKDVAELLLASTAEVNAMDGYGLTPLDHAMAGSRRDVTALLLANGAEGHANVLNNMLVCAVTKLENMDEWYRDEPEQPQVAESPHEHVVQDRCSEFFSAVKGGDSGKVKKLLKDYPDLLHSQDSDRETPLHVAAGYGRSEVAALLLHNLEHYHGRPELSTLPRAHLLNNDRKSMVNAQASWKNTPLHLAASNGHPDVVALLLVCGADVNAEDALRKRPLDSVVRQRPFTRGGKSARYELVAQLLTRLYQ